MKKKIDVLILTSTYPPQHTGSGLLIDGVNKYLELDPSVDFNFKVFCFTSREIPSEIQKNPDINFVRTDINRLLFLKFFIKFLVESFKTDIVLVVTLVQPLIIIASLLSLFFKKKIILEHTLLEEELPGIIRKLYKYTTYRFLFKYLKVYSTGLATQIQNYGFKGKIFNFGAQVDLDKFRYEPQSVSKRRQELGIKYQGKNCFTFVGAMSYRKGLDRIMNLLKDLDPQGDYFINLIGPNTEYYENLYLKNQELVEKLIAGSKLNIVIGKNERVNDYLMCSDFFLFPTRNEGFGAVLIEAMASGCIPLSSEVKGVTDDFLNHQNSLHFQFTQEEFFENFLKAINMDYDQREKLINQGLKDVTYYSLERVSNEYKSMYLEVANVD